MANLNSRYLWIAAGIVISAISIYLAIHNVAVADVFSLLTRADPVYVGGALLGVAIGAVAKAARWRTMLGAAGARFAGRRVLAALLAGQVLNVLLPVRAGDVGRAYLLDDTETHRGFVFGTIVVEKIIDLVAYVLLFVPAFLLLPSLPNWISGPALTLATITVGLVASISFLMQFRNRVSHYILHAIHRLPGTWPDRLERLVRAGFESIEVLQSRQVQLEVIAWTAMIWVISILINYFVLLALDITLPFTVPLLILLVLQAGITIPAVPGRIGIFEYLCVLTLALFGIDRTVALGYGILLHAIVFLPHLLSGLFVIWAFGYTYDQDYASAS